MKLLVVETGRPEMEAAVRTTEGVASAEIGYVELRAALGQAIRAGRVQRPRAEVLSELERLWDRTLRITVDGALVRAAGELADRLALRGYDAVHLAALEEAGPPEEVTFACWDNQLRRAAQQLGYTLVPA